MNNGTGMMTARMYNDEKYRIVSTVIHPHSSIGLHTQHSGDDMNYIITGHGKASTAQSALFLTTSGLRTGNAHTTNHSRGQSYCNMFGGRTVTEVLTNRQPWSIFYCIYGITLGWLV